MCHRHRQPREFADELPRYFLSLFFCPVFDVVICEASEARGGGTGGSHEYTQQYFITKDGGRSPTQGTMNGLRSGGGQDHSDRRRRCSLVSASTCGQFFSVFECLFGTKIY